MDTLLKPARLDLDPNSHSATKEWKHWHRTLKNVIDECGEHAPNKFRTPNHLIETRNSHWIPPRTSEAQQGLQSQKCYC